MRSHVSSCVAVTRAARRSSKQPRQWVVDRQHPEHHAIDEVESEQETQQAEVGVDVGGEEVLHHDGALIADEPLVRYRSGGSGRSRFRIQEHREPRHTKDRRRIRCAVVRPATTHLGGRWFPDATADGRRRSAAAHPTRRPGPTIAPDRRPRRPDAAPPAQSAPRRSAMNSPRRSRTARRWSLRTPAVSRPPRHARRCRATDGERDRWRRPAGERRQNPDVRHGRVADHGSTRKGEPARHGISGADELVVDECADGAAGLQQLSDLPRCEVGQPREPDHRGAEHVGRGNEVVLAVEHANLGGHPAIMPRARWRCDVAVTRSAPGLQSR